MLKQQKMKKLKDQKNNNESQKLNLTHRLVALLLYATTVKSETTPSPSIMCPSGSFFDASSRTCAQCVSPCEKCIGTSTNCLSCTGGAFLSIVETSASSKTQTCSCPQGSMWDGSTCANCPVNCATCDSTTNCLACLDGTSSATCSAPATTCSEGQYYDSGSTSCKDCSTDGSCASCYLKSGATEPTCTKCNFGTLVTTQTTQTCQITCPLGDINLQKAVSTLQVLIKPYCVNCIDGCESCRDRKSCAKCFNGYELTKSRLCAKIRPISDPNWCPRGYFLKNGACEPCSEGCSYCDSATNCLKCLNGLKINNGACQIIDVYDLACLVGQTVALYSKKCIDCTSSCLSCKYSSSTGCKQCFPDKYVYGEQDYSSCKPFSESYKFPSILKKFKGTAPTPPTGCELGQFSPSEGQCKDCGESCAACSSEAQCTTCRPGYIQDPDNSGRCILEITNEICGTGRYPAWFGNKKRCLNCPINCEFCVGDGKCYTCYEYYQLTGDSKVCFFHPGRYYPQISNTLLNSFGTCSPGYYKETNSETGEKTCKSCGIYNCIICTGTEKCDVCKSKYYFDAETKSCKYFSSSYSYTPKAEDGSTENGSCSLGKGLSNPTDTSGTCSSCSTMTGEKLCAKCSGGEGLYKNQKCNECYEGYYQIGGSTSWVNCESDLLNSPCKVGYRHYESYSSSKCTACGTGCERCDGYVCLKCYPGYRVTTSVSGYGKAECERIPDSITNLEDLFKNVDPTSSPELFPPSPASDNTCLPGYYFLEVNSKGQCVACGELCLTCSDHLTCNSCIPGYLINLETKKCDPRIPTSEMVLYDSSATGYSVDSTCGIGKDSRTGYPCTQCMENCAICSYSSPSSYCKACYSGFELRTEIKTTYFKENVGIKCTLIEPNDLCGDGAVYQRDSEGKGICHSCPSHCKKCIEPNICTECEEGYERISGVSPNQCKKMTYTPSSGTYNTHTCPKEFYSVKFGNDFTYCSKCDNNDPPCQECSVVNNEKVCTKCQQDSTLKINLMTGKPFCESPVTLDNLDFTKYSYYTMFYCSGTCYTAISPSHRLKGKYKDSNNVYHECISGCAACDNTEVCVNCFTRFSPVKNSDEIITACDWNYSSWDLTKICRKGTFFKVMPGAKRRCLPCPDRCDSCSSSDVCDTCETGYTKNSEGICLKTGTTELLIRSCPLGSTEVYNLKVTDSSGKISYAKSATKPKETETGIEVQSFECGRCGDYHSALYQNLCSKCSGDNQGKCEECINGAVKSDNGTCYGPEVTFPAGTSGPVFSGQTTPCGLRSGIYSPNSTTNEPHCLHCYGKGKGEAATCEFDYNKHPVNVQCFEGFSALNSGNGTVECYPKQPDNYCPDGWSYALKHNGPLIDDVSGHCIFCGFGCKSCLDEDKCIECFPGETCFLWSLKDTLCPQGKYHDQGSNSCQDCNSNCASCSESSTKCSSCPPGLSLDESTNTCICPPGQFKDGSSCSACPYGCEKCNSATTCETCATGFKTGTGSAPCDGDCETGKYKDSEGNCQTCNSTCTDCISKETCTSCPSSRTLLVSGICRLNCGPAQFVNKDTDTCENCPTDCGKCTTEKGCLTCKSSFKLFAKFTERKYKDIELALCTDTTTCSTKKTKMVVAKVTDPKSLNDYEVQCQSCGEGCDECDNPDECKKCSAGFYKKGSKCFPNCQEGQFQNTNSPYECINCIEDCAVCENTSECKTCKTEFEINSEKKCYKKCLTNQYRDTAKACQNCPEGCATCSSATECLTCTGDLKVASDNLCHPACPTKQFRDIAAEGTPCAGCPDKCSSCSSLKKCSGCDSGSEILGDNLCYTTCTATQFRISIPEGGFGCDDCPSGCSGCESKTKCSGCSEGNTKIGELCYPICTGTQFRKADNYCENCPDGCSDCTSSSKCGDCKTDFTKIGDLCYPTCTTKQFRKAKSDNYVCDNCQSSCATCEDKTSCKTCPEGNEVVSADGLCHLKCDSDQWRDLEANGYPCKKCSPTPECSSCKTGDTCDACVSTHDLVGNACLEKCEAGKWRKRITGESDCQNCMDNCLTCDTDTGKCSKCDDDYTLEGGKCLECPTQSGWYLKGNECLQCELSCKTCENGEKCKDCPDGEEVQPDGVCAKIVAPPTPPADTNEPKVCSAGSYLKMVLNQCLDCEKKNSNGKCIKCKQWKYDDGDKCVGCNKRCKTCFGPGLKRCFKDSCTNSEYKTYKGFCTCPEGKFASKINGACDTECHSSCGLCLGSGENSCLTCKEDGAIPDTSANKLILGHKVGSCINCAKNSADYPEICGAVTKEFEIEEDSSVVESSLDEAISGSGDGEIAETALDPTIPERKTESESFSAGFNGLEQHEERLKDDSMIKNLFLFIIEGYKEGIDFLVIIKFNFITKKIDIGIRSFKDMVNAKFTMSTRNFGSLQNNELTEDEQTWDGEYRRILQDETTSDDVILKEQSFSKTITARRVPSEGAISFAKTFGKISRIFMLVLFIIGILLCLLKFIFPVNFDGHYLKLLMLIEFFTRSAMLPVNFGNLLSLYFDEMVKFDLGFMWKFINEGKFRGLLGGKLDEYRIPLLLLNSLPLATIVYFISFIAFYTTKKFLKNKRFLRVISGVHFVVMGITILDVIFYGTLEIFHHNPVAKGNSVGSIISYIIALVTVIFSFIDIGHLFLSSMKANTDKFEEEKKLDSFEKFAFTGLKEELVNKDKLVKVINFGFIIRLILAQILIANFQKTGKFIPWALFAVNFIYEILFFALVFMKKPFSSKFDLIQKIVLEVLIFSFLIMVLIFAAAPENKRYASSTTETFQRITMFVILFAIISETALFAFRILTGFKNVQMEQMKSNKIQIIGPETKTVSGTRNGGFIQNQNVNGQKKVKRMEGRENEPSTIKNIGLPSIKPQLPVPRPINNDQMSSMQKLKDDNEGVFCEDL